MYLPAESLPLRGSVIDSSCWFLLGGIHLVEGRGASEGFGGYTQVPPVELRFDHSYSSQVRQTIEAEYGIGKPL